ncbi:MAG TPA: HAMP domain-containing sensor histidine kinase [Bryobacteraceae bacterium]|nr:HAMP domain-containing sensor histidine kinase [Bryobacteraceae bacterium]
MVAGLAITLLILAFLQYHWIGQVSAADRERMELSLNTSAAQFIQDFRREIQRPAQAFRPEPVIAANRDWDRYIERYEAWLRTTPEHDLLNSVFLVEFQGRETRLLELDAAARKWREAAWPAALEPLRTDLEESRTAPQRGRRGWTVYEQIPAMAHLHVQFVSGATDGTPPEVRVTGALVLTLSPAYLWDKLLPDLAQRHFGAGSFDVSVVDRGAGQVLFRSDPAITPASAADIRIKLLGPPPEGFPGVAPRPPGARDTRQEGPGRISPASGEGQWELDVRHRRGSLDDVVTGLRRRNLAVSFGILLLLAAAMTLMVVSTRRAQRLAKLQIDFVAGVSHELRTPVAVICSAGDNLADGIVDPNPRVKQYGALVRGQGHRLREMVEQILAFAAGEGGRRYELRAVDVEEVIESTLSDSRSLVEESGAVVERHIEPGLPHVVADHAALKQCLHNLITNGLKYGGDGRWLGITARSHAGEVHITVADKGIGIGPDDLAHIFDPFYRGEAAIAAQIHGTGLGLSLARDLIEGMGGSIEAASAPGKGSEFTLRLKAAPQSA